MIKSCHVPKLKEIGDIYFKWMKADVWACLKNDIQAWIKFSIFNF